MFLCCSNSGDSGSAGLLQFLGFRRALTRFAGIEFRPVERSLKEAGSELKARLQAGNERRFPLMGIKGAANALMLRQAVIELARPIIAITSLASEAEALAGELAFFLDQPA